jgi:hypothetical protein
VREKGEARGVGTCSGSLQYRSVLPLQALAWPCLCGLVAGACQESLMVHQAFHQAQQ